MSNAKNKIASPMPLEPRGLGERLRWLRKRHGLTQMELSCDLGCEQAVISSWEVGRTRPCATSLAAVARYYRVSSRSLQTGDGFMLEAARDQELIGSGTTVGTACPPYDLPRHKGGTLMVVDRGVCSQDEVDHPEGIAVLIRGLTMGRKVWVVID